MDKPTEKLTWGKMRTLAIPLSHENDLELILIFKERNSNYIQDSKRFLVKVNIVYKDKKIAKDIVDINRFIVSLKIFAESRNNFAEKDIFFTQKTKDKLVNLQCNFDKNLYIGKIEAMQMVRNLQDAFTGYSKAYLFDEYTADLTRFMIVEATRYHPEHIEITKINNKEQL